MVWLGSFSQCGMDTRCGRDTRKEKGSSALRVVPRFPLHHCCHIYTGGCFPALTVLLATPSTCSSPPIISLKLLSSYYLPRTLLHFFHNLSHNEEFLVFSLLSSGRSWGSGRLTNLPGGSHGRGPKSPRLSNVIPPHYPLLLFPTLSDLHCSLSPSSPQTLLLSRPLIEGGESVLGQSDAACSGWRG